MLHVVKQWLARAVSLCVLGPAAAWMGHRVLAADGTHQTTLLTGASIGTGVVSLLGVLAIVMATGVVVSRTVDRREGLLSMGFVLGWVAWTSGQVGEIFRVRSDAGTLVLLAIEGLLLTGGVVMAAAAATNPQRGGRLGLPDDVSRFDAPFLRAVLGSRQGLAALGASLLAALIVAMLFGRTDLPGQSVGVGFGGGVLAGVVGAMVVGSMGGKDDGVGGSPFAPIMIGVMLCAVVAPLIGLVRPGAGELERLVLRAALPGYLVVSPSAWVMGALIGVPVGHSWVEHSHHHAEAGAKAAKAG